MAKSRRKIRGITIELGGDASGLSKALEGVNSPLKTTERQLKDVERLLKLDPGNVDLLAQKQKLLGDRVKDTKAKLEALKKVQDELDAKGADKMSQQYMAVQREIALMTTQLQQAEEAQKSFNIQAEKLSATFDTIGNKAQTVADKTKALSAAGAAVVGAFGAMAVKAMKTSDDLNTLAAQTGFTTAELQKFDYAADRVDVSSDTIVSAVRKMKKAMDSDAASVKEAWQSIGVSVTNADGSMRDATEVFYDALDGLSKVGNETERDTIAMQLFGKSADDLATIIDDGGAALKAFGDEAEAAGLIWSQESIDAANAVKDLVDGLKADINQTILITGAKALEALRPIIENVIQAVSNLLGWLGDLDSTTLGIIMTVAAAVAAISPVAGIIAKISMAASSLITIIESVGVATVATVGSAVALVAAIAAAVAALAVLIYRYWDEIVAFFKSAFESVKSFFEGIKTKVTDWWDGIVQRCKDNIQQIIDWINKGIEAVDNLIEKVNTSKLGQAIGLNIGTVGTIPGLAGGGMVSNGGSAIVGERGAELLTVNQGAATVTPISNSTTYNTYNQASSQPLQVTLMLDKTVLAREMVAPAGRASLLAGGSCIR